MNALPPQALKSGQVASQQGFERSAQALSGKRTPSEASAAAREFEAMFVAQMLKPVFDTLPRGGMFSGGPGEKIFQGLLVEQYGRAVAASGGVGIAEIVEREMLARQQGGGDE